MITKTSRKPGKIFKEKIAFRLMLSKDPVNCSEGAMEVLENS